ncbi:unnamed protein product [Brachionus calyciflorus]|uniref:C2H2-type domain-containing protein n=1 Tax=Brachionus calyciflorus TaxID=104777 RepID=A0A813M3P0_9BILA|nr:unnamed protein product [Brachionus calyciflorus]
MNESQEVNKKKARVHRYCPKLDEIQFNLKCEWSNECNKVFSSMDLFLQHVDEHLEKINSTNLECKWLDCDSDLFDDESCLKRHVRFHAFHTKLKNIGLNVLENLHERQKESKEPQNIPKCNLDDQTRNVIPELPYKFECSWDHCDYTTDNPELFYRHIKNSHVDKFVVKDQNSKCLWSECEQKIPNKNRLVEHIRHHSQEKLVACPDCGALFASFTKFIDHCSRSSKIENMCFQCSHCNKKFATNNLLKEHIRKHVNKFKCPNCDMTCIDKKDLEKHILYKHTNQKAFKCPYCDHSCKTQYDLLKHVNLKHNEPCEYACDECDFKSKDFYKVKKHMLKPHGNDDDNTDHGYGLMYMCHICQKTYSQGSTLSKHLKTTHSIQWPSGHSRFRYKLETDGYYRLQTLRYESAELVEEFNKMSKIMDQNSSSLISNFESDANSNGSSLNNQSNLESSHLMLQVSAPDSDNFCDLNKNQNDQFTYLSYQTNYDTILNCNQLQNNIDYSRKNDEDQEMETQMYQDSNGQQYMILGNANKNFLSENPDRIDRVEFDIEHFLNSNFHVKEQSFKETEINLLNNFEHQNESMDFKNIDLIQTCSSKIF